MRALLLAAALLAFAPSALAQQAEQTGIETSRALIDSAQLNDVFVPIEHESPAVRHTASGLTCHFFGAPTRMQLAIFDSGLPRGDDVACVSDYEDKATTLYATRYAPSISLDEALAGGVAGIRHRFADARPQPQSMTIAPDGVTPPRVAQFLVTVNGERWFTSVTVAEANGWIYKLRYSARAVETESLTARELEAGSMFALMLGELSP
jgi:hypothetical protein